MFQEKFGAECKSSKVGLIVRGQIYKTPEMKEEIKKIRASIKQQKQKDKLD